MASTSWPALASSGAEPAADEPGRTGHQHAHLPSLSRLAPFAATREPCRTGARACSKIRFVSVPAMARFRLRWSATNRRRPSVSARGHVHQEVVGAGQEVDVEHLGPRGSARRPPRSSRRGRAAAAGSRSSPARRGRAPAGRCRRGSRGSPRARAAPAPGPGRWTAAIPTRSARSLFEIRASAARICSRARSTSSSRGRTSCGAARARPAISQNQRALADLQNHLQFCCRSIPQDLHH